MTFIQQFIEKALVGGWQPADRDFTIIGRFRVSILSIKSCPTLMPKSCGNICTK
jgi:hypothetical protein